MTDDFDPYYTWLGIPPEDQPATHYRLLGVREFEPSLDVISNAGDQRMAYLRTFQVGKRSSLSQRLLNEMAAAKVCLLDIDQRKAYDAKLKASKPKPAAPAPQVAAAPTPRKPQPQPAPKYSPPAPLQQVPVTRPLPVAARLPGVTPDPFAATDPFADAAKEVQSQPMLPAKPAAEASDDFSDQAMALVHAFVGSVQAAPLAAAAYGMLALGVVMLLSVGLWIGFGGRGQPQPIASVPETIPGITASETPKQPDEKTVSPSPSSIPKVAEKPALQTTPTAVPTTETPSPGPTKPELVKTVPVEKPIESVVSTSPSDPPPPSTSVQPPPQVTPTSTGPKNTSPPPATTVPQPAGKLTTAEAAARLQALGVSDATPNPNLTYLNIHNPKFTDEDVDCILAYPRLTTLYITGVPVTSKTWKSLQNLSQLETLGLSQMEISDDDMEHIGKIKSLKSFSAHDSKLTVKCLEHLKGLSNLERIHLPETVQGNVAVPYLVHFPNLKSIVPIPNQYTDEDLKIIGKLRGIEFLDLQGNKITLEGFKQLANLTEARTVFLPAQCPPGVMIYLSKMKLESVYFPESSTEKELELFQGMGSIRVLRPPLDLTDEGLKVIARFGNLDSLELREAPLVTDAGLGHLAKLKSLKKISLARQMGEQALIHISRLEGLEDVEMDEYMNVTEKGLQALASLPKLKRVGLSRSVDDKGIRALAKSPTLKDLFLRESLVTADGFKALQEMKHLEDINMLQVKLAAPHFETLKSLKGLKSLMLQQCSVPPDEAAAIKAALPNARVSIF